MQLNDEQPTAKEISDTLQLFRRELDKNMHNSSGSPGHDAMTTALHALFKGRAKANSGGEVVAWIPVSERLPENNGHYWTEVAPMFGSPFVVMQRYSKQNHIFISGWEKSKVTHWKPVSPPAIRSLAGE